MKTRRSGSTLPLFLMMLAAWHVAAAGPHPGSTTTVTDQGHETETCSSQARSPQLAPGMTLEEAFALKLAFGSAVEKLERDEDCRGLFQDLPLDGLEALARIRYQAASSRKELSYCARGAAAFTAVGAHKILICKRFLSLRRPAQTAILIHEALHTAGLSEAPLDPDGMTSREITRMVEESCSL